LTGHWRRLTLVTSVNVVLAGDRLMRSHKLTLLTAVTALVAGVAAGAVATASPADAVQQVQQCTGGYTFTEGYGISANAYGQPIVQVYEYDQCNSAPFSIDYPVSIQKYVGNVGWVTVATGMGYTDYVCSAGTFLYTTNVTTNEGKAGFYCTS
jgi:hypothetical protein